MSTNRPIGIWILIVVFAWSAANGFDILTRMDGTTHYKLFEHQGAGLPFLLLASSIVALDIGALWVLFRPRPIGYRIVLANLVLSLAAQIVTLSLGMANPEFVQEIYASEGASGGPPIPEGQLETLTSPPFMIFYLGVMLVIFAALIAVTVKKRAYFFGAPEQARVVPPANE